MKDALEGGSVDLYIDPFSQEPEPPLLVTNRPHSESLLDPITTANKT